MTRIACEIVEVCVFRFVRNRPEYLVLQRAPEEKIYPNLWQMVSGSVNEGEKAVDAALREFREETELPPRRAWVVPFVNSFYDPGYDAVNLSPLFAVQVDPDAEPRLSDEHRRSAWLSYEAARERLVWPGQRAGLDVVHAYIAGGQQAGHLTEVPIPQ